MYILWSVISILTFSVNPFSVREWRSVPRAANSGRLVSPGRRERHVVGLDSGSPRLVRRWRIVSSATDWVRWQCGPLGL